jgi:hypothetical protein
MNALRLFADTSWEERIMRHKSLTAKGTHFRALKAATFAALVSGSIALFGAPPAHALILSVGGGSGGGTFGGFVCADVAGGKLKSPTNVQAYDCQAAPDQQYEWVDYTIYTIGGQRCLDVLDDNTSPGATVDSANCNGTGAQMWEYNNGQIINVHSGLCLDATNMANTTLSELEFSRAI